MKQTRREFLQTLSAGTMLLSGNTQAYLHEGKKLGIALVGLGNYATNQLENGL